MVADHEGVTSQPAQKAVDSAGGARDGESIQGSQRWESQLRCRYFDQPAALGQRISRLAADDDLATPLPQRNGQLQAEELTATQDLAVVEQPDVARQVVHVLSRRTG
jgi:hypothetical protein